MSNPRLVVALDFASTGDAEALAARLDPARCRLKVGKELFTRAGPAVVRTLAGQGFGVFLDLKFHDIPNTVAGACRAAADLGVWMLNVHASGGRRMLESARAAIVPGADAPLLVAVTVLTSLALPDLAEIGITDASLAEHVLRMSRLSRECGLDGVVCSPREAAMVRADSGPGFTLVTPGIRPADAGTDDQRRTSGVPEAILAGSDYLVVGRPITRAAQPMDAVAAIEREIEAATASVASSSC